MFWAPEGQGFQRIPMSKLEFLPVAVFSWTVKAEGNYEYVPGLTSRTSVEEGEVTDTDI